MKPASLKNRWTVLGAAAVAAVPLALMVPGAASGNRSQESTFKLVELPVSAQFVDLPPTQGQHQLASVGDEVIFVSSLQRGGKQVGLSQAVCVVTTRQKNPQVLCNGTFRLPGGTLAGVTSGRILHAKLVRIAITGGTRSFAGAGGSITSVTKPNGTAVDTVRLLDLR